MACAVGVDELLLAFGFGSGGSSQPNAKKSTNAAPNGVIWVVRFEGLVNLILTTGRFMEETPKKREPSGALVAPLRR